MSAQTISLSGRDLLQDSDLTPDEFRHLLGVAAELKAQKRARREVRRLEGRSIALIFEKTSTRTRCAFEIAAFDQGGHATVLDPASSQIGHKESTADTARVLSRFYDGIQFRGAAQATVEELARYADVPVWNGLTDDWHPTQALADALTMHEASGTDTGIPFTYIGDARNNVAHSLLVMGAMLGHDVRIAAPASLWPSPEVQALAGRLAQDSGARLTITEDPVEALEGSRFVHTDVWVSMGEPKEVWQERIDLLRPYRVDAAAMAATGREDAAFMHCLPAFHDTLTAVGRSAAQLSGLADGIEVSDEVFESARSLVFEQAENRLHTIKALLVETLA